MRRCRRGGHVRGHIGIQLDAVLEGVDPSRGGDPCAGEVPEWAVTLAPRGVGHLDPRRDLVHGPGRDPGTGPSR